MERLWTVAKHKRHGNNANIDACRQRQNTLMVHKVMKRILARVQKYKTGGHLPRGCILVFKVAVRNLGQLQWNRQSSCLQREVQAAFDDWNQLAFIVLICSVDKSSPLVMAQP